MTSKALEPLKEAMTLWGPDSQGSWHKDSVGLGHLMLHTTPESLYEQLPAVHPHDANLIITADARIDNREELFMALNVPAALRAMPDSSLILLAYERWGRECVGKLIGAFAFAIWDQRQQVLFCGRDHIGFKPFYYYNDARCFIFASDIEGILACAQVPQRLNEPLVAAYLQEGTFFAEKRYTYWRDIVKLPPAHHLFVTTSTTQLVRYWSLDNVCEVRLPSDEAYAEQLRELLREAVQCRIRTAFPVGSHLSGGLDSSTVTAIAARLQREKGETITAYSWSPPPSYTDNTVTHEYRLIQAVCSALNIKCNYIDLTVEDVVRTFRRNFTRVPYQQMLWEELVQQQALQNKVRVMLSGWGGDEAVTGHGQGYWSDLFLRGHWWKLHRELLAYTEQNQISGRHKAKQYVGMAINKVFYPLIPEALWVRWHGDKNIYPLTCIEPTFAKAHQKAVIALRGPNLRERPGVQQMQWRWLEHGHLTDRIESWAVNGARQGIVYHYPLLDRRILEFCLGTPAEQFVQQGWKRSLMRRAVDGLLPETVQWRRFKAEPAFLDVYGCATVGALPILLDKLCTEKRNHPVPYIDMQQLKEVIAQTDEIKREVEVLLNTIACARVCPITTANEE